MTLNLNEITTETKVWFRDALGEREGRIEKIYTNSHEIDISDGYGHHTFLPIRSYECREICSSLNKNFVKLRGNGLNFLIFELNDEEYDNFIND